MVSLSLPSPTPMMNMVSFEMATLMISGEIKLAQVSLVGMVDVDIQEKFLGEDIRESSGQRG